MHYNSELLFRKYAKILFKNGMRVLEIGPDCVPSTYEKIFDKSMVWETVDMCSNKTTYTASSEYSFPIPDNTYDIVFAAQVIEHVRKIWVWIKELSRVCKPGGFVILINPVKWPYHEAPYDCWRIYPEGMRALYEEAGLEVIRSHNETLDTAFLWSMRQHSIYKKILALPYAFFRKHLLAGQYWKEYLAEDTITIGKKRF